MRILLVAKGFMIAPIAPPAKGPTNPMSGELISKHRRAGFSPNIIQQIIHGIATRSICMPHGVRKIGGRVCMIMVSGANIVAPAIFIVGLLTFICDHPMVCFSFVNLFKSNYPLMSKSFVFSTKGFKEFAPFLI